MDVIEIDFCIVHGYRLTEYQVFNGNDYVFSYFNIRDNQGVAHGRDYNNIKEPLEIMLNMCITEEIPPLSA